MPKPTVTYVPSTSKPTTSQPPKQPPVPVYKPTVPPQPTPMYVPPAPVAQPTVQTNVSPDAPTLPAPVSPARQPIKARQSSQPAPDPNAPWGKLVFGTDQEVQLSGGQLLIGRIDHDVQGINPDIDLSSYAGADTTSRIHATIERVGSQYTVTDLNSTNATRVNGKRIEPDKATSIADGDTLLFGKVTCTFKKV